MSQVILRLETASFSQLMSLGVLFGTHVLNPLVAQHKSAVVASYGPQETGKSNFARNAVAQLPAFFSQHADDVLHSRAKSIDVADDSAGAFRCADFGPGTIGERLMNEELGFVPRRCLADKIDPRYAAGVDILEHAPNWHLANADFIVLTRMAHYDDYSKNLPRTYFNAIGAGVAGYHLGDWTSFKGPFNCDHPRTAQILSEMHRARDLIGREKGKEARAITIILGNDRPEYRAAFSNFVKAVGL